MNNIGNDSQYELEDLVFTGICEDASHESIVTDALLVHGITTTKEEVAQIDAALCGKKSKWILSPQWDNDVPFPEWPGAA